mgnify:CR=1 FL=1
MEILNIRALAELSRGRLRAAKGALDLAMVMQPDYADGHARASPNCADRREQGRRFGASSTRRSRLRRTNVDGWVLRGDLNRQLGNQDAARIAYQKAVEIDPRNTTARLDLAAVEINTKYFAEAATELEAVRKIDPRNVTTAYLKALLEFRQGRLRRHAGSR